MEDNFMEDDISGIYDDDGTKINPNIVPKPPLCLTCKSDTAGGEEELLCLLNRHDQRDSDNFECGAYDPS